MEAINNNNSRIQTHRYNSKSNNEFRINIPKVKILFRNEEFLVIDKPYDVKIDGDCSKRPTVLSLLYSYDPTLPKPLRNVHQLDYSTSGCYCLALTKLSAKLASIAFTKRTVKKSYLAIVRNWMKDDNYIVDQSIAEVPNNRYRMCLGSEDNLGKEAKTEIKVIKRGYFHPLNDNDDDKISVTLIQLFPITGRRHQLRLHCLYLKHPILGDYHYENLCENLCYTDTWRMMLHAHKLFIPLRNNNNGDEKEKEEKEVIDEIKSLDVESDDPFSDLVHDS